jgi:PBP1b-binding outer membrane lipoprotein LpoB
MKSLQFAAAVFLLFLLLCSCSHPGVATQRGAFKERPVGSHRNSQELSKKLQNLVDSMIDTESKGPIHNAVLLVEK